MTFTSDAPLTWRMTRSSTRLSSHAWISARPCMGSPTGRFHRQSSVHTARKSSSSVWFTALQYRVTSSVHFILMTNSVMSSMTSILAAPALRCSTNAHSRLGRRQREHSVERERRSTERTDRELEQEQRVVVTRSAVQAEHAAAAAPVHDEPLAVGPCRDGDRFHRGAALGPPVAGDV